MNLTELNETWEPSPNTWIDLKNCFTNLPTLNFFGFIFLAIFWTFLRFILTTRVFIPFGLYFNIPKKNLNRFPESGWKFSFYLFCWSLSAYILFSKNFEYLRSPRSMFQDYSMSLEVPTNIYILYLIEISFYVHSIYATLVLDEWRKDSKVMLAHHIFAICLFLFSLSNKCHRVGLVGIFLHDICDVILEGTKVIYYFKTKVNFFETLVNIGFGVFTLTWFFTRLYLFPLRSVYTSLVFVFRNDIRVPLNFFLILISYIIILMHIYWFSIIVSLIIKIMTGQVEKLEDSRDFKDPNDFSSFNDKLLTEKSESKNTQRNSLNNSSDSFLRKRKENILSNPVRSNNTFLRQSDL